MASKKVVKNLNDDLPVTSFKAGKRNIIPSSALDGSSAAIDYSNVAFIKRKLIEEGNVVCFCFNNSTGKQLLAKKKTAKAFVCCNTDTHDVETQVCGFRANVKALEFMAEHDILMHPNPLLMPICKSCGGSWLLLSESEKIREQLGQLSFVCHCMPYSTKINIPIENEKIRADYDIAAYYKGREKTFGVKVKTASIASASAKPVYYIPE
jgi:hypothetical protein